MLLDTNVISAARKPKRNPDLVAWIGQQAPGELRLPGPVLAELVHGVRRVTNPASRAMYEAWLGAILSTQEVVGMEAGAWALYGEMLARPALASFRITPPGAKRPHLAADLQIAAIALDRDEVLATLNYGDFARIAREFRDLRALNPLTGQRLP